MRRSWLRLVVAAGVLLAADSLLWVIGTQVLASRAKYCIAQAHTAGWSISTGDRFATGWPFAATLAIDRIAISGGERLIPGGLAWSADHLAASVSLLHPFTVVLAAEGQQFLRLSHFPDIAFTATATTAHVGLWAARNQAGEFLASNVAGGIAGSRHPQDVQLASLLLRLRRDRPPAPSGFVVAQAELHLAGIGLPDIGRWPLGATIAAAGATLTLSSPVPPQNGLPQIGMTAHAANPAAEAASWRAGGGRLELRDAMLRWGPLALNGSAELQLDDRLQPAGSGTADISGTAAALDAATQGGVLTPGVALAAKAVLAVMPGVPGTDAIRLPFRLRDSTVSVGEIPLARLGEIAWGR